MSRVVIDTARCTGNGRCYTLAPELFIDDERGYGQVISDSTVAPDQIEKAHRAVIACPEQAISLI